MIDNKKPSLIFNVAQVDSEEDVGNEIMKSEGQEVEINSLKIVHFYGNCLKQIIVNSCYLCKGAEE